MKKKKVLWISIIVIIVGAVVILNLTMDTKKTTSVQSEPAKERRIIETVSASGRIQPRTKVNITSEINGEIINLYAREGDKVEAGKLLVVLDTVQLKSDVDQAKFALTEIEARIEGYKASVNQTKEELERQEKLLQKDGTAQAVYDNAKYAHISAKANYEAGKASLSQSQARYEKQLDYLSKAKIIAPMSGVITFLDCEIGEIAAAQSAFTQGRTLMTISDLSIFEVEVEVDETEINKIELKQKVDIEVDAFPDTTFPGEVVEIGNTALLSGMGTQDQTTNFKVKVIFQDPNVKIRPGMSATVDITSSERDKVLTIPYSAIVMRTYDLDSLEQARSRKDTSSPSTVDEVYAAETDSANVKDENEKERLDIKGVFVIREGIARFVKIESGIADKKNIEVVTGIEPDDSVITGPYRVLRTIKDGDMVKVEKSEKKE